ncbi:beta-galactosidase-1-like protein 2 [Cylas formicarius]|uniref:beta-galactosidase-1-like protein 2 n=1 Tax=Cylas formicarius TaxID=197179 RepID=UPI0029585994|nr:beta-galactosidase-1-like protein 2 [Cylas formicarius]
MALVAGSLPITANLPTNYEYYTSGGINRGLSADQSYFTLNDKLVRIYSGAMHYFRVPRAYWRDRLKKIRAAGLNTVESYVPWNLHEPETGKFDFGNGGSEMEDFLHLEEFLQTAKEEDLFVILRTGPYICAEYNFGGFPSWLLREETVGFRTSEPTYMKYVTRYFNVLLTLLAAFQFTKGGPIVAFQVENEYGNQEYGDVFQPEKAYLEQLRQLFISNGIQELLVTSDSPLSHGDKGTLPGIFLQTANLGDGADEQLDKLEELQPGRPLMVMEFWAGWYQYWGENQAGKTDDKTRSVLNHIVSRNASFNVYVFHGGTNFGFNNGATMGNSLLDNAGYKAITTSYDYDAPLSENGDYRTKYTIIKDMIVPANPVQTYLPDQPEVIPPVAYNNIQIIRQLPLDSIIEYNSPYTMESENVIAMEKLDINHNSGQSNGYIVYRKENLDLSANAVLKIAGHVCDTVVVLVNGNLIGPKQFKYLSDLKEFGFAWKADPTITLTNEALRGATLDIIVEEMGRMNGGKITQYNHTFKGLWQGDVTIDDVKITNWKIIPLELKKYWVNHLQEWQNYTTGHVGPTMYNALLRINDEARDTFVDLRGWGKGMVFVNGFPLGRYAALGPQQTLYLPAPFLTTGYNYINMFEHFYAPDDGQVRFSAEPIYVDVQ